MSSGQWGIVHYRFAGSANIVLDDESTIMIYGLGDEYKIGELVFLDDVDDVDKDPCHLADVTGQPCEKCGSVRFSTMSGELPSHDTEPVRCMDCQNTTAVRHHCYHVPLRSGDSFDFGDTVFVDQEGYASHGAEDKEIDYTETKAQTLVPPPPPDRCKHNMDLIYRCQIDRAPGWSNADRKRRPTEHVNALLVARAAMADEERRSLARTLREFPWCPYSNRQVSLVRNGASLFWHCSECYGAF